MFFVKGKEDLFYLDNPLIQSYNVYFCNSSNKSLRFLSIKIERRNPITAHMVSHMLHHPCGTSSIPCWILHMPIFKIFKNLLYLLNH